MCVIYVPTKRIIKKTSNPFVLYFTQNIFQFFAVLITKMEKKKENTYTGPDFSFILLLLKRA